MVKYIFLSDQNLDKWHTFKSYTLHIKVHSIFSIVTVRRFLHTTDDGYHQERYGLMTNKTLSTFQITQH